MARDHGLHCLQVYIQQMHVNAGDKHVIKCKILIVFFLSISFNIRIGSSNELITTFLLEPTTDVKVGESGTNICIRNVEFQHIIDHNIFSQFFQDTFYTCSEFVTCAPCIFCA